MSSEAKRVLSPNANRKVGKQSRSKRKRIRASNKLMASKSLHKEPLTDPLLGSKSLLSPQTLLGANPSGLGPGPWQKKGKKALQTVPVKQSRHNSKVHDELKQSILSATPGPSTGLPGLPNPSSNQTNNSLQAMVSIGQQAAEVATLLT